MNILELSAYFYPHKGGIECVIYNLCREWTHSNKNDVTVISSDFGSNKKQSQFGNIRVYYLKSFGLAGDVVFPSFFRKVDQLNKINKFDVALIHHPHPFVLFCGAYSCKKNSIPYYVHMHGTELKLGGIKGIFSFLYNKIFLRHVLSNARGIFVCNKKIVDQSKILKEYKEKIHIIPHGINYDEFRISTIRESRFDIKKKFGLDNQKIVLYVGVFRDYKRLDILVKSMVTVFKKVTNSVLVLAGNGPEKKKLVSLVNELGLTDKIRFVDIPTEESKFMHYKISDVFVLPSPTIMESFGLVALEAISTKVPVVVSSGAGISELFDVEGLGIIVNPFDSKDLSNSIIKLLNNCDLSEKIASKAYNIVKNKYQWGGIAKSYLNVFEGDCGK